MSAEAVTIERLRVRWRGEAQEAYTPATRLRLERLIGALDLRPPAMPPGAVLLIRRVDGLPPLTRLDRLSPEWARQVQQRIAELYRSARPPASAPPDAACVVFADAADMLMQFTQALVREPEHALQHWYWRELVPPAVRAPGAALAAVWAAQARALPPALARLPLPEVCAALVLLAPAETGMLVRALAHHYALSPAVLQPLAVHIPSAANAAPSAAPQQEIWRGLLPAAPLPRSLPAHAAYLFGLGRALYHAPAQVRRMAGASSAPDAPAPPVAPSPTGTPASGMSAIAPPVVPPPESPQSAPVVPAADPTMPAPASSAPPASASSAPPASVSPLAPGSAPLLTERLKPLLPEGIETTLGGVLYLANVLGWLGWPQQAALRGWSMLEALARALLECADDDDPLWAVLAGLDGRETGAPLSEVPAPDAFRLPIQRVPATWEVVEQDERAYLMAAGGAYLIADVPRDGRPLAEQVQAEMAAYGMQSMWQRAAHMPFEPLPAAMRARLGPSAAFWAERMRGYVRGTLEQMLDEPLAPLLARAGRVVVSQTHIDLYMGFNQICVATRRVGLDANPGWVPDLGYILLFHFVEEADV